MSDLLTEKAVFVAYARAAGAHDVHTAVAWTNIAILNVGKSPIQVFVELDRIAFGASL